MILSFFVDKVKIMIPVFASFRLFPISFNDFFILAYLSCKPLCKFRRTGLYFPYSVFKAHFTDSRGLFFIRILYGIILGIFIVADKPNSPGRCFRRFFYPASNQKIPPSNHSKKAVPFIIVVESGRKDALDSFISQKPIKSLISFSAGFILLLSILCSSLHIRHFAINQSKYPILVW